VSLVVGIPAVAAGAAWLTYKLVKE
jgi:hypothetical protein